MTDTEILNWIETEMQTKLGDGGLWHVMHEVHRGVTLREAVSRLTPLQADAARHEQAELFESPAAQLKHDG